MIATMIVAVCLLLLAYAGLGVGTLCFLASMHLLRLPALPRFSPATRDLRFAVIVPAHDEEASIGATLTAIAAMDYPPDRYQTFVVADNCEDDTARRAAQAGALVLERRDPEHRGKGYALRHAFDTIVDGPFDAVVVIDADTRPTPNLLRVFAAALAAGKEVAQCRYGTENPQASAISWALALGNLLENDFYHEPQARLGLPTILRGNGMCFTARVLREIPWSAYSITEDTEYGLTLLTCGIGPVYLPEAGVLTRLPETWDQLATQRQRWALGNADIIKGRLPGLLAQAVARRQWLLANAAWSLLIASKPQLCLCALIPTLVGLLIPGGMVLVIWGGTILGGMAGLVLAGMAAMPREGTVLRQLLGFTIVLAGLILSLSKALVTRKQRLWTRTGRS